jgi:hypothetical protein
MKKHLIIIGILTLLVSVELSGCDQVTNPLNIERNRFIGNWRGSAITMGYSSDTSFTFLSDGSFTSSITIVGIPSPGSGTWEIKDNLFVINGAEGIMTFNYVFSSGDNSLTLTSTNADLQFILIKQ